MNALFSQRNLFNPCKDDSSGHPVAPHLSQKRYSTHGTYAAADTKNTVQRNVEKMYCPTLINPNQNANTGTMDQWQQGLGFKTVVPNNEQLWQKNPWFFANGEAREYFGGLPSKGDIDFDLSGQPNRHTGVVEAVHDRLGRTHNYAKNAKSSVDRMFN